MPAVAWWLCWLALPAGWSDPGFEQVPAGSLPTGVTAAGWEIQRTGRAAIQDRLRVDCLDEADQAKSGRRCLALAIPTDTVGFEYVTVGRRLRLAASQEYEAAVWVRWPDGPEVAPANAGAIRPERSAIVSFWARHRNATGHFAGRDVWLFDRQWHRLSFRFRATDPAEPTLVYVSLLPGQQPAETTVLVDDFELTRHDAVGDADDRTGCLTRDPGFTEQVGPGVSPPWSLANLGGQGIQASVQADRGDRYLRLAMDRGTSNFESAQLWQHVLLYEGVRYAISCRVRWDSHAPGAPPVIVNYGVYHDATNTWYGPVDQLLEPTTDWRTYRFHHIPPDTGPWKLYVQLNGWGNFGQGVTVSVDDLRCELDP